MANGAAAGRDQGFNICLAGRVIAYFYENLVIGNEVGVQLIEFSDSSYTLALVKLGKFNQR